MERQIHTLEQIQELALAFQRSCAFLTAFELGFFSALGRENHTAQEVASRLNTDPRASDRLLNALCALGLIKKTENRFSNSKAAARFLVEGQPEYMAGLMHTVHVWQSWGTLTEAIKKGGRVEDKKKRHPDETKAFIAAMHQRAMRAAPVAVARLDLTEVTHVLDVGGGSGAYAMAFVRSRPGLRATIFDLPEVITLAKRYVSEAGLSNRIDFVQGDYYTDDLGSGFDLVLFSAILHSNSPEQNQVLIIKASRALNPGGQVVVQDFIMTKDRTEPPWGTLFALNMLVNTTKGDTYTGDEVISWLKQAGLSKIIRSDSEGSTALIIGRKI